MSEQDLAQYRVLLTSSTRHDNEGNHVLEFGLGMGITLTCQRSKPIVDVYTITEETYKLADKYKIGLVGNNQNLTPNENFYVGDLRSMLSKTGRKSHLEGIYQAFEFGLGSKPRLMDLVSITRVYEGRKVTEVFKVDHIRSGVMAFLFGTYRLREINGLNTLNMDDFDGEVGVKIEILFPAGLPGLSEITSSTEPATLTGATVLL